MHPLLRRLAKAPAPMLLATALASTAWASALTGSFERALKVSGPVDLEVSTGSGDIVVRRGEAGTLQIRGKIKADDWSGADVEARIHSIESNPPVEQEGNHIKIGRLGDHQLYRHLSIDYDLVVPEESRIASQSGSGDLTIEGIHGPVNARSGSGDVKLNSVRGDVQLRTGSGNAKLVQISGDRVEIETGSGDVGLRAVRCALQARTGSGDITAEGEPTGEWVLHAGSGGINLRLPSSLGFDLDAHTSSGEVSTSLPITVRGTMGHGDLRGQVRGGGVRIDVQTGSGDIRIE